MKASSPVSTPCSTPVSPGQHVSPTPKPDRTYPHLAPPQPLPDSAYPIDHRYWYYQNTDRQTDRQIDRYHASYLFYSVFCSDFGGSCRSRVIRSPLLRCRGTDGPCITDRCQNPASPSLLRGSSRSTATPSSNIRPWWGRHTPRRTRTPWWSNKSLATSPTTQVSFVYKSNTHSNILLDL